MRTGNSVHQWNAECDRWDQVQTLRFEHHATIENTLVKLKAMYNPLKRFAHQFMPGYKYRKVMRQPASL